MLDMVIPTNWFQLMTRWTCWSLAGQSHPLARLQSGQSHPSLRIHLWSHNTTITILSYHSVLWPVLSRSNVTRRLSFFATLEDAILKLNECFLCILSQVSESWFIFLEIPATSKFVEKNMLEVQAPLNPCRKEIYPISVTDKLSHSIHLSDRCHPRLILKLALYLFLQACTYSCWLASLLATAYLVFVISINRQNLGILFHIRFTHVSPKCTIFPPSCTFFFTKCTIFAFNLIFLHITEIFSTNIIWSVGDK